MKLLLEKGQKVWFTSDTHYNHINICRGTTKWKTPGTSRTRNFDTLADMNDKVVQNINSVVGINDILIHLGDWSFGGFGSIVEFRERILCRNIHLVLGNHDHHIARNKEGIADIFNSVHQYVDLSIKCPDENGKHTVAKFVLMHYPIASWDGLGNGVAHLHGHVHLPPNSRIGRGKVMDVGVDGNNFFPISMQEVQKLLEEQPVASFLDNDHHTDVENYRR